MERSPDRVFGYSRCEMPLLTAKVRDPGFGRNPRLGKNVFCELTNGIELTPSAATQRQQQKRVHQPAFHCDRVHRPRLRCHTGFVTWSRAGLLSSKVIGLLQQIQNAQHRSALVIVNSELIDDLNPGRFAGDVVNHPLFERPEMQLGHSRWVFGA